MVPDTGERYLSTPLFADVPAEMTDEELELSRSTPGQRFDVPAPPASPVAAAAPSTPPQVVAGAEATAFIDDAIRDSTSPVVLFALEWCEFCWSVRRFFARLGVQFRSIDLDSVAMQAGDFGGRVRTALAARTGMSTIPQLFVGGELVGGCTETLEAWRAGRLQHMLQAAGVSYDAAPQVDSLTYLPGWLQPR
jgi:cysteine synthase A